MNKQFKKEKVSQNIYMCKYSTEIFSKLPQSKSVKTCYINNFNINPSTNLSQVYVKSLHPLLLASEFIKNGMSPVVVSSVFREFDGSNIEASHNMYDDMINVKTNFAKILDRKLFPLQTGEIVYNKPIHIIRDDNLEFITNPSNILNIGLILASPLEKPVLSDKSLSISDYINTKEAIEGIFQTACFSGHDVLILGDFGCKMSGVPIKDIIDIYNLMIVKYCFYFKYIIVALPIYDNIDMALYTYFNKEIIQLQNLGQDKECHDKDSTEEDEVKHDTVKHELNHNL